ncbi:MAG: lactonase family protein [Pseudomonadota bacterium]
MGEVLLFVGSLNREQPQFEGARGVGLSVYAFDEETCETRLLTETGEPDNPTYLAVSGDGRHVFVTAEVAHWREGTVTAYGFDPATATLTYRNKMASLGSNTSYCTLSPDERRLYISNYGSGSGGPDQCAAVFRVETDGTLGPPIASVKHGGAGPHARQDRPHAHCVMETQDGQILVADLGADRVFAYRASGDGLVSEESTALPEGAGPRHLALHGNGQIAFLLCELTSTLAALALGEGAPRLLGLLPLSEDGPLLGASDIQISPDGRFVYCGLRGPDTICEVGVDEDGTMTLLQTTPCGGKTPRNLCLTPSGKHLLCANQNDDHIAIFARDAATGRLMNTGRSITVGTPMCVRCVEVGNG